MILEYPALLRDAGIAGTTLLDMFINTSGVLENALVAQSSGYSELDRAALRVARTFEFLPAQNDGRPAAVWIQVPITFQPTQ